MLQKLLALASRLPVARFIKPLWKMALKAAVNLGGDKLQEVVKVQADAELSKLGGQVGPMIEDFRKRIDADIEMLPIPDRYRKQAEAAVDSSIDNLQQRLAAAAGAGSIGSVNSAIDGAFDAFQAQLISRIDAL